MSDFATNLKKLRELRHLTQAQLGERAGMEQSAISHYETGTREPSLSNLLALAKALCLTPTNLLGWKSAAPHLCETCKGHGIVWKDPAPGSILRKAHP